ncbi:hypothetical protein N4R57_16240 [Rhodobacteraceae bacterium D3-12]|nr:hypothetical protein N4R57_16240 [Rhodobacteraceae bacterium D3-12]
MFGKPLPLVAALFALLCLCLPASADPRLVWSIERDYHDAVQDVALDVANGRAILLLSGYKTPLLQIVALDSGAVIQSLERPASDAFPGDLSGSTLALTDDHIVASGRVDGRPHRYEIAVFDRKTLAYLHSIALPRALDGYEATAARAEVQAAGRYALQSYWEIDSFGNPIYGQFDLVTGSFVRAIRFGDVNPDHDPGSFGAESPNSFTGPVTFDGTTAYFLQYDKEHGGTIFAYDLARGAALPKLTPPDTDGRIAIPAVTTPESIFYNVIETFHAGLTPDLITVSSVWRVNRASGAITMRYEDPFDPGDQAAHAFTRAHLDPKRTAYTGTGFPSDTALSEGRLVAGAPNAPVNGIEAGAYFVFDAATGALLHQITAPYPRENGLFGHWLSLDGPYLLVQSEKNRDVGQVLLYRLD